MNARTVAKMWQNSLFPEKTLPDICINFKQSLNGASDPWVEPSVETMREFLNTIIETWDDNSLKEEKEFDNAVLTMVKETIKLINYYGE